MKEVSTAGYEDSSPRHREFDKYDCTCVACHLRTGKAVYNSFDGRMHGTFVHSYSDQPTNGWKPRRTQGEVAPYFLGVELETDNDSLEWDNDTATSFSRPKGFWFAKSDSSVSGPEFASMPASMNWWRKHEKDMDRMFRSLIHGGFRSYDNDNCGMHVNISRSAFKDAAHLFRFLTLIHTNATWAIAMAQRTESSAGHWAPCDLHNTTRRRRTANRMFTPPYGWAAKKYTALGAPEDMLRFEFRLPRGTLRTDRFYKNLEWTHAMIEFTRTSRLRDVTAHGFMLWSQDHESEYPNLNSFIHIKGMLARFEFPFPATSAQMNMEYDLRQSDAYEQRQIEAEARRQREQQRRREYMEATHPEWVAQRDALTALGHTISSWIANDPSVNLNDYTGAVTECYCRACSRVRVAYQNTNHVSQASWWGPTLTEPIPEFEPDDDGPFWEPDEDEDEDPIDWNRIAPPIPAPTPASPRWWDTAVPVTELNVGGARLRALLDEYNSNDRRRIIVNLNNGQESI